MSRDYRDTYPPQPQAGAGCLGLVLLVALIFAGLGFIWWMWPGAMPGRNSTAGLDPAAKARPVVARGELAGLEQSNIDIYEQSAPSLAQITNLGERSDFLGLNVQEVPRGVGSGFVWDDDGHIVTNYHVVEDARAAHVTLSDKGKTRLEAKRVWAYPDKDIAVLWVDVPKGKLTPIKLGTSHDLKVGQLVYALGDPFGLDGSMSFGIVSALGRQIKSVTEQPIHGVIQTTAPLNPGNSGGPLLDSSGRLVGMNTAILSPTGAFAGIGFAIPVDEINRIVPQLIKYGKVVRPYLGVQLIEDTIARRLGVDSGVLIGKVVANGPAAKAGLRGTDRDDDNGRINLGDVITAVDGKQVKTTSDLHGILGEYRAGDTIKLTIERDSKEQQVSVTLGAADQR